MLSKPNVDELMKRAGSRYEVAIAIAKRAREIAAKRIEKGDQSIKDAVDLAAIEIFEEKVFVKRDGEYILKSKNNELDIDTVISNTVDDILKDLAVKDELLDLEKPKKVRKTKKETPVKKVTEIVDEEKSKIKSTKKVAKKEENNE